MDNGTIDILFELKQINTRLETIERLLRNAPETMAAVLIQMKQEAEAAAMQGKRASDIWEIANPTQR